MMKKDTMGLIAVEDVFFMTQKRKAVFKCFAVLVYVKTAKT